MLNKIEQYFKDFVVALQTAKLYTTNHPMFKKAAQQAFLSLSEVLKEEDEIVIGIIGEELASKEEIFFDLSKMFKPTILYLKERGIEKISFYSGVQDEELEKFINFVSLPKENLNLSLQEHLFSLGIRNISAGKIKVDSAGKEEKTKKGGPSEIYGTSLSNISQVISQILDGNKADHLVLKFSVNSLLESLISGHQEILKLSALKRYDAETYTHLLNVSILAMYFSSSTGLARQDVMDIGIAALFHDIGKLYISRRILNKNERLSESEFSEMKSHTVLGAEIMLGYVDSLGFLPVVVCCEHHLKYDLSGYPRIPILKKPHIASLIVSMCDVYDALSQRRSYKADYSPDMIYNTMNREKGTTFDPILLDKFFSVIGVWPIGSIIALDNSEVAVVREQNKEDIFLPKVEVVYPDSKRRFIDLRKEKEHFKIERFLNPWKEGKDYLHLI